MALSGCAASFLIGANTVAELTNISNAMTGETLDVTSFDSGCVREFVAGLRSGTIDVSGFYDPTDTNGQVALVAGLLAGTAITAPKFLVDGTNGFTAVSGIMANSTVDAGVDGLVNFSASIQLSGAISVVSA